MAHNTVCRSGADVPNATPQSTGFFSDLPPLLTRSKSLYKPSRGLLHSSMRCSAGRLL